MHVKIQHFRGCRNAEIPLNGITLVAGMNGQGKTSIAQAVAAVLCGSWQPAGIAIKKKEAEALVFDGEKKAIVTMTGDDGSSATLTYPKCEYTTEGAMPPQSDTILTGLSSLVSMTESQRVIHLLLATGNTPGLDDLREALPDIGQDKLEKLWGLIQNDGWDAAHETYKKEATKLKGEWRAAAGSEWGEKKATDWAPETLTSADLMISVENAHLQLQSTRTRLESAWHHNARIGLIQEGDQQLADTLPELEKQLSAAEQKLKAAQEKYQQALQDEKTAEPWISTGWECPHCQGKLSIDQDPTGVPKKIRAATELSPEEIEKRNLRMSQIQQNKIFMKSVHDAAAQERNSLLPQIRQAKEAAERIQSNQEGTKINVAQIEQDVKKHQQLLEDLRRYHRAKEVHERIVSMLGIAARLDSSGEHSIRQIKVSQSLEAYNAALADCSRIAGYKPVQITPEMAVTYDGRRYEFLSASEQYRVRIILQIAEPNPRGEPLVIDAIDILDAPGRNGLIKLLRQRVPLALLTGTMKREETPDLSKIGGLTIHIENGQVVA